jgi:hypothetical protein
MEAKSLFNEPIQELKLSIKSHKELLDAELQAYPFAQHLHLLKGISSTQKKDRIIAQCYVKNSTLNKYASEELMEAEPIAPIIESPKAAEPKPIEVKATKPSTESGNSFFSWLKKKVSDAPQTQVTAVAPKPVEPVVSKATETKPVVESPAPSPQKVEEKPIENVTPEFRFSTPQSIYFDLNDLKTPAKNKVDSFIESYLVHEPKITPKKELSDDQEDLAKESAKVNVVSETLAKIYLQQGHHEKATKAFEKLSLKYPEKSAYFAALAKEARLNKK